MKHQFKWFVELTIEAEDEEGAKKSYEAAKDAFFDCLNNDCGNIEGWDANEEDK